MRLLSKCGSFALLFVLSLIGSFTLFSNSATASSDYDNVLNLTTDTYFRLQNDSVCNDVSITGQLFTEFMQTSQISEQIRDDYMNANSRFLTNIQGQNAGNINNTFMIGYGNNLTLNWDYALTGNAVVTSANTIQVGCKEKYDFFGATGEPELYLVESGYNDFATVSYKSPDPTNDGWALVYFTGNPNYPSGYSGTSVPESVLNIPDYYSLAELAYWVNDKKLELKNITPNLLDYPVVACSYKIYKVSDPNELVYDSSTNGYHMCDEKREYTVSSYGSYLLELNIWYDKLEGQFYDNTDFILAGVASTEIDIDGTTFSGVIAGTGLTSTDKKQTDYEDCTSHGWDVAQRLTCEIRNLGLRIRDMFTFLIIPNSSQINTLFTDFNQYMNNKLGFLWSPFNFFSSLLQGMMTSPESCSINTSKIPEADLNGTFFGSTVHLNVCSAEQDMPRVYNLVVFIVRVVTVLAFAYALYARAMSFLESDYSRRHGRGVQ